ncbi:MAG: PH domain-containing protein [Bacteroidia bacterium]|nr:PH domain-containing protein [Bacteroidia bacterium]
MEEHLDNGEKIHESIFGVYEGKLMGTDVIRDGIFVATEKRVIFYAKKLMGYDLESFPLRNISSVERSKGLMGHKVTIIVSGNEATLKWINQGEVSSFIEYLNDRIGNREPTSKNFPDKSDIPDQTEKLSILKNKGILTEDEFTKKKNELLSRL